MSRTQSIQSNLTTGILSPTVRGRIDLKKYYSGVEQAENVVIMPHGGMERRSGLKHLTSVVTGARLMSFEFSLTQRYVIVLSISNIKIYLPDSGTALATVSWNTAPTQAELNDMDIIQSADTVIITHQDHAPQQLQRQGSDTSWALSDIPLSNIPRYDFDYTKAPTFSNYGESLIFDIAQNDIVYNRDGNNNYGLDYHLYKANYPVSDTYLKDIDFSKIAVDYTNTGSTQSIALTYGDIVLNADGNDRKGYNNHVYMWISSDSTRDLSLTDYSDSTIWRENGTWQDLGRRPAVWGVETDTISYTNTGTTQTVSVVAGNNVLNSDGNDINGLDGYVYRAFIDQASIDLSTQDFTDTTKWRNIGQYDNTDKGYPRTCTFHQGRLWLGGSGLKPTAIWGSVVNDFYNFDTGKNDVKDDDAIFDIINTDQFNIINNICAGKALQVITASGEFVNTADVITPSTSAWENISRYGGSRINTATLDGATYYVDRFAKTARGFIYSFEDGGYITPPISILSEHLLNDVKDMSSLRGTSSSVSNLVYMINGDGTVAVYNTMRHEDISGWTKWTTSGNFKRVTVTNETVTFIVERSGTEYLEVLDSSVLLDHAFTDVSTNKVEVDALLLASSINVVADGITQTTTSAVDESGTYYAYADRTADSIYAGLNYTVIIKTLPVAIQTQSEGYLANRTYRITRCYLNIYESRGVYVNGLLVTNRKFGDPTDQVFAPVTGIETTYLLGYNRGKQLEITQSLPDPMTILSIDLEISY